MEPSTKITNITTTTTTSSNVQPPKGNVVMRIIQPPPDTTNNMDTIVVPNTTNNETTTNNTSSQPTPMDTLLLDDDGVRATDLRAEMDSLIRVPRDTTGRAGGDGRGQKNRDQQRSKEYMDPQKLLRSFTNNLPSNVKRAVIPTVIILCIIVTALIVLINNLPFFIKLFIFVLLTIVLVAYIMEKRMNRVFFGDLASTSQRNRNLNNAGFTVEDFNNMTTQRVNSANNSKAS